MKTLRSSLLTGVLLCTAAITTTFAQSSPAKSVEPLNQILIDAFKPYEAFFPNIFDPTYHKELTLDVWAGSVSPLPGLPGPPAAVHFKFDWIDLAGAKQYSPDWEFIVGDLTHLTAKWEIPYCPQEVSIHFEIIPTATASGTVVSLLDGTFTHECMIPEASETAMLMGMGALSFGMIRWYRKPRTA